MGKKGCSTMVCPKCFYLERTLAFCSYASLGRRMLASWGADAGGLTAPGLCESGVHLPTAGGFP